MAIREWLHSLKKRRSLKRWRAITSRVRKHSYNSPERETSLPWSYREATEILIEKRKSMDNPQNFASLFTKITPEKLRKKLIEFGLTPEETQIKPIVFVAGYNGKVARIMKSLGYNVIFTDRQPDWVERAAVKGMKSVLADASHLPFKKGSVSAIVSFEPYSVEPGVRMLGSSEWIKRALLLNPPQGVIIIETIAPFYGINLDPRIKVSEKVIEKDIFITQIKRKK